MSDIIPFPLQPGETWRWDGAGNQTITIGEGYVQVVDGPPSVAFTASVPVHCTPLTSSTERTHLLSHECWCLPNVLAEGQGEDFRILEVHHQGQLRPGDRVAVDDPSLAELRQIMREATGEEQPPNNEGTVEEAWDDGTLLIYFDDGVGAPYPASECRRIG